MATRKSLLQKLRLIPVIVLGVSFITYNIGNLSKYYNF
nr:MAG TPA: hypothetical protein [Caudoviricetes sp.]